MLLIIFCCVCRLIIFANKTKLTVLSMFSSKAFHNDQQLKKGCLQWHLINNFWVISTMLYPSAIQALSLLDLTPLEVHSIFCYWKLEQKPLMPRLTTLLPCLFCKKLVQLVQHCPNVNYWNIASFDGCVCFKLCTNSFIITIHKSFKIYLGKHTDLINLN